jgi:hypothetical protein
MERNMARYVGLLFGAVALIWGQVAQAESMVPPICKCNDDCKYMWPYTGICELGYGSSFCGWTGPGIPCDGGAAKDVSVPCTCDQECYGGMVCKISASGKRFCSVYGPGTPCDGGGAMKDVLDAGPPKHACSCNKDCSYYGLRCNKTASGTFCTGGGEGIPCTPDIGFTPEWDDPGFGDMWWPRDGGHFSSDGDPNAVLAPRAGCALGAGGLTTGALPGIGVLLLAGVLLALGSRRSRRAR